MQIPANDIHLEYQEHGPKTGDALILIRGLGTQLAHWPAELIEGFVARGFRTITFDNRDVGLSDRCPADGTPSRAKDIIAMLNSGKAPQPAYQLTDMVDDVIGLMDSLSIEKAHIFGISMGGRIAQNLATDYPDRLLSDTMVMTAASLRDASLIAQVLAWPLSLDQAQDGLVAEYAKWGSPGYQMKESDIRELAADIFHRSHDAEGVNRQALATFAVPDRRRDLEKVDLPCLVIHGADDALIPPDAGRELAGLIPGAELHVLDGMGHIITPKLAPLIVDIVSGFIKNAGL